MDYWVAFIICTTIAAIVFALLRRKRALSATAILALVLTWWTLLFASFALLTEANGRALASVAGTWALFAVPFTALFVWRMRSQ